VQPYCAVPIMCSSGAYLFSDAAGPDSEWPEWVDPAFTLALTPSVSIAGRRTPPRGADRVPWLFISGLRGWFPAPVSSAPDCIDPGFTFGGAGVCANAAVVMATPAAAERRSFENMFRFLDWIFGPGNECCLKLSSRAEAIRLRSHETVIAPHCNFSGRLTN
jgi:hypothetical protein